jgi:hypothetical protein
MRTIFELSAENAKIADCLAEDAVCCEPVSDAKFPDQQANIQGNFTIMPRSVCLEQAKRPEKLSLFEKIP